MKRIVMSLLAACLSFAWACNAADENEFGKLETLIETAKAATGLPSGTAIAIIRNDRVIYEGYFGYADIRAGEKVDAETVFYIASATKPFFALNALLKSGAGQLKADASLQSLFPKLDFNKVDAKAITVKDLLVHTSGIRNEPIVWATAYSGVHDAQSRRALVAASYPNDEASRGEFSYSNVGYNMLSVAMDSSLGTSWQDQLDGAIFSPLGMEHTSAYMSEARKKGWKVARPYSMFSVKTDEPLYLEKMDSTMHAAGGMVSTVSDLARFLVAQLNEGRLNGAQVFPSSVIRASQERQVSTDAKYQDFSRDGYAWGWYTGEYKGKRMLHHFGGFSGFHSHLSFIPEENLGLVVLNNEDMMSSRLTSIVADLVYGILLKEPGISEKADTRLAELLAQVESVDVLAHREKINARPWSLSRPMGEYAGTYENELLGTIEVEMLDTGRLHLAWGNLETIPTGYEKPDVVRVEFAPNSGELLSFIVSGDAVEAIDLDGIRFSRR